MAITAPYRWKWDCKDNAGSTTTFVLPKHNFAASASPAVTDDGPQGNYTPGSLWLDTTGRTLSILIDGSDDAADWLQLGSYSDEQAQDAVGGILVDSSEIDFTYSDATPSITASLITASVALSKLATMATSRILGNVSGGAASPSAITITQALDLVGSTRGNLAYRGASTWSPLTPGTSGHLLRSNGAGADPSYASISAIIDTLIGSTRGSVLYRGASGWAALTPGTSGYQLTSQGAGADPTWAAAAGSIAVGDLPALNGFTDADPALDDVLPGYDTGAAGNRDFDLNKIAGLFYPSLCDGRLTPATGSPWGDNVGTTLYFTPLHSNRVALYDGTRWKLHTFTERSITDSGLSNDTNYDVFLYDNAGTLTLELVAWSSDTARATALTTQDGVHVKSGATTRRYLGTIRTRTVSSTSFSDASGWPYVWNAQHRRHRPISLVMSGSGYNYSTAAWRSANNDTANRLGVVVGLSFGGLLDLESHSYVTSTGATTRYHGIDEDGTASSDATYLEAVSKAEFEYARARMVKRPSAGFHFYQATEYGSGAGAQTWYNQSMVGTWES